MVENWERCGPRCWTLGLTYSADIFLRRCVAWRERGGLFAVGGGVEIIRERPILVLPQHMGVILAEFWREFARVIG